MIVIADPLPITHCSNETHSLSVFHSIRPWTGSSEEQKEHLSTSTISWTSQLLSLSLSFLVGKMGRKCCSATFSGFLWETNEVIKVKGSTADICLRDCLVSEHFSYLEGRWEGKLCLLYREGRGSGTHVQGHLIHARPTRCRCTVQGFWCEWFPEVGDRSECVLEAMGQQVEVAVPGVGTVCSIQVPPGFLCFYRFLSRLSPLALWATTWSSFAP